MIHAIFHTYYPDLSEPKPSVRRSSLKRSNAEINNIQSSQVLNRPLPSLLYSSDVQQFLEKFKFQYSDVNDDKYSKLCSILVKYQHCYATNRNNVGKKATLSELASNQIPTFKLNDPLKSPSIEMINL